MRDIPSYSHSLRERKKNKLREELIASALQLFTREGFDNITIDNIVDSVGVSRRTFFRYFDTKEDVIVNCYDSFITDMRKTIDDCYLSTSLIPNIKVLYVNYIEKYENNRDYFYSIEKIITKTPAVRAKKLEKLGQCAELIDNQLLQKKLDCQFSSRLVINLCIAIFKSVIDTWVEQEGKGNFSSLIEKAFQVFDATPFLKFNTA